MFNTQSVAKVVYHKKQLHNIRKDNRITREYLSKIKTTCDLEAVDHKVSDLKQILTILNELSDEYEVVIAVISSQMTLPLIDDVHSILLAHEARTDNKKPQELKFAINYTTNLRNKSQNNNRADQSAQRGPEEEANGTIVID